MNKTKKNAILLLTILLLNSLLINIAYSHTEEDPYKTDLIAGQYMDSGDVLVWNDGENLFVKYVTRPGWYLTETHLQVFVEWSEIPLTKSGSPKIGKFEYNDEHDYLEEFTYTIPLEYDPGDVIKIAAHAVVSSGGLMGLCPTLPSTVTVTLVKPHPTDLAYFHTTVSGGTSLDGTYTGWCIDSDNPAILDTPFPANVYCSYETLPSGLVEYPENLDLVNWIINQNYVGKTAGDGFQFTYGDVQMVIWTLIEDNFPPVVLPYSQAHVDEIVAAAYANGEGYVPGSGAYLVVILAPLCGGQPSIIKIRVPCEYDETAWGQGTRFRERGDWSMYFTYTIQ